MSSAFSPDTAPAAAMQWKDDFLLGYGPVDHYHQEFVEVMHQLQTADAAQWDGLFETLRVHLHAHFESENKMMLDTDFPPRDCHIKEHAAVMQSLVDVQAQMAQGDHSQCQPLIQALADWFPAHTQHLDSALVHWVAKHQLGGKPVIIKRGLTLR